MWPEEKKARIEQIIAKREMKRSTQTKDSIAMENPRFIEIDMSPKVTPSTLNVKYRKHATSGDKQTLLPRSKKLIERHMTMIYASSEEDTSTMKNDKNVIEPLKLLEVKNNGNNTQYSHISIHHTPTIYN